MQIVCSISGKTLETEALKDGSPKLPPGAKRLANGAIIFADAKKGKFFPLAQHLPVAEVISVDDVRLTAADGRKQLLADLWLCWRQCAQAMNWMLAHLFSADGTLQVSPKGMKLPKFVAPRPDDQSLYLATRTIAPDIASTSVSCLTQDVIARYRRDRFPLRVLMKQTLHPYRSPQPLPVRQDAYMLWRAPSGRMLLSLPVRGRRWVGRLKGGSEFRRQIGALESVLAGNGWLGSLKVIWGKHKDIMLAISVFLPKRERSRDGGTMIVRTRPDKLWGVWTDDKEHAWKLHEDHILRLLTAQRIAEHDEELQRLSDDSKCERRMPKSERSRINNRRRGKVERYANRVNDALHRASTLLANYAERRRVAKVVYDERDHSYWPSGGPWHSLAMLF